jgi:hypothetical protein
MSLAGGSPAEDTARFSETPGARPWTGLLPRAIRTCFVVMAIAYVFAFAGDSLRAFFTGDDLMNI